MNFMKLFASFPCRRLEGEILSCAFSTSSVLHKEHYKLVVLGGGTGGAAVSNQFGWKLGKGSVAVVEPNDSHYYQPMWTLVGAGAKKFEQSRNDMKKVLSRSTWIKEKVVDIKPDSNLVITDNGKELEYDYLVVALGIQLRYELIKGLPDAFNTPGICSNYNKDYVLKTYQNLQAFKGGNAIFTFPDTPIKCAGAPQKIMYLADQYFRKHNIRDKANIMYNTSLGVIFGVKKYAAALEEICKRRNLTVNYRHVLTEVKADTKEAVFNIKDAQNNVIGAKTFPYEFLHVAPPCSAPEILRKNPLLVDGTGFLSVSKETLQHTKYPNIFGIGDCTTLPTSKTAAAVAAQARVLRKNLGAVMANKKPTAVYDGYTSCPLTTTYHKCILAEFDYDGNPLETFPVNQAKERVSMFYMKKEVMPWLYWHGILRGWWEGPWWVRKILTLK